MALTINAKFINGMDSGRSQETGLASKQGGKQNGKNSMYAGNLNLAQDPIAQRRKEAQEKALNVVRNAWNSDQSIDKDVQSRREHYANMNEIKEEAQDSLNEIINDKSVLKQFYEVDDESQEQKDLELLEKRQDIKNGVGVGQLTADEMEYLDALGAKPLTEYQARALELNNQAAKFKKDMWDADKQMKDDTANIHSIQKDRLKYAPVLDAQKTADDIMEAANKEMIGIAMEEAKENIEEVQKEAEEKAEEAMNRKEEKEELLEELEEKRAIEEALIEGTKEAVEKAKAKEREHQVTDIRMDDMVDITKGNKLTDNVQQSLDDIKNSMKLLDADLKGLQVDEEV